ncbi:MAG: hypothetical protein ABEJ72_01235 [Candidatus Aenigmatarchaeota archaeon]
MAACCRGDRPQGLHGCEGRRYRGFDFTHSGDDHWEELEERV